jgi:hypothetical protein
VGVKALHPVTLAYLRELPTIYPSLEQLIWHLDDLQVIQPHRAISFHSDPRYSFRFPIVSVEYDPFTPALNQILFDRFDFIGQVMLTHTRIVDRIIAEAQRVKTIVLVLLDGLSYADCRGWPHVEPCLATLPTITRVGFPSIINDPPIAMRLFTGGFTHRVGFTYWERDDEPLTRCLFRTISDTRKLDATRPHAFDQVLDWLSARDLTNTYVQIVRTALDDLAEGHRTPIPRTEAITEILRDLEAVVDILRMKGRPAMLFAIADHGILWKDQEHPIERVTVPGSRYAKGQASQGRGRLVTANACTYWVLDYPQMGRAWKSNEQGVHGGISFEETIVPFMQYGVNIC